MSAQDEAAADRFVAQILEDSEAFEHTSRRISQGNAAERWWAVRVLSEVEGEGARALIRNSLTDPDPAVRQCAALALRSNPDPEAEAALITLLHDEDRLSARLAGDALAQLGGICLPVLAETLANGPPAARVEAARALALMNEPGAIPALFMALDDDSALVEHWADEGLQRQGIGMVFFR